MALQTLALLTLLIFLLTPLLACANAASSAPASQPAKLEVGQDAPAFTVKDQDGKDVSLTDFKGQWVILYFYPKADTPGCTTQACDLSDNFAGLRSLKAMVLGCSADTVEAQKKFAEKYRLPFTLLADTGKTVLSAYQALQDGRIVRSTVLIDPEGKIAHHWPSVSPKGHAQLVKQKLEELQAK